MKQTLLTLIACAAATAALAQQDAPGTHFLAAWDLDGDGTVTLDEALERREMVFDMFDDDQDGILSPGEYDAFDATRAADMQTALEMERGPGAGNGQRGGDGQGPGGAMVRAGEGLARDVNDADGNGAVTLEEFLAGTAPWLDRIDRTADGAVTQEDFGPGRG